MLEGKAVEVDDMEPAGAALPVVEDALARYSQQRRRGFKGHGKAGTGQPPGASEP
jgi:hypothetical protein